MNRILPILLSINLLLSSFSVSPNPFINKSIKYNGFTSIESAMEYYYDQIVNNKISYSKTDLFTMHGVLAHLRINEDVSSVSSSLIADIDSYFSIKNNVWTYLGSLYANVFLFCGYILKNADTSSSNFLTYLSNFYNWTDKIYLRAFAWAFDYLTFTNDGLVPQENFINVVNNYFTSVVPDQSEYYNLYDLMSVNELLTTLRASSFVTSSLYSYFYNDVLAFSKEHKYFVCLPLCSDTYGVQTSIVVDGRSFYSSFLANGYILLAVDIDDYFPVGTASNSQPFKPLVYSLYDNRWNTIDINSLDSDVICRFYNSSYSSNIVKLDSFDLTLGPGFNSPAPITFNYSSDPKALNPLFSSLAVGSLDSVSGKPIYDFARRVLLAGGLSTCYFRMISDADFISFKSLSALENYTLENGIFWKVPENVYTEVTNNVITYNTYEMPEQTIVNNSTTAYNTINQYITNNDIKNIDESTQKVINNNYETIYNFNFDVDLDLDFTINNIDNINNIENNYWNDFNVAFDNSGLKDTSFTSFNGTDFSAPVASTLGIINIFYNFLPVELKWLLFILFAIGIFGMVIGAIFKSRG